MCSNGASLEQFSLFNVSLHHYRRALGTVCFHTPPGLLTKYLVRKDLIMDSPNICVLHEVLQGGVADMLEMHEDGELLTVLC